MTVLIERKNSIFTVIINRPDVKNCIDEVTAKALAGAFLEFEKDDEFSVAVLCGNGDTFCAGWDLKAGVSFGQDKISKLTPSDDGSMGPTKMLLTKPVIAAISGYAVAGGLELALWCDLRVMEESAKVGVFCRRFGVPLFDGGTVRLPRLIGMSHAMDLILTGRSVDSNEAKHIGLANRVVKDGTARKAAEELAAQIAKFPQVCLRSDRMSTYEQWDKSFEDAMNNEFRRGLEVGAAVGALSGAESFTKGIGKHGEFS